MRWGALLPGIIAKYLRAIGFIVGGELKPQTAPPPAAAKLLFCAITRPCLVPRPCNARPQRQGRAAACAKHPKFCAIRPPIIIYQSPAICQPLVLLPPQPLKGCLPPIPPQGGVFFPLHPPKGSGLLVAFFVRKKVAEKRKGGLSVAVSKCNPKGVLTPPPLKGGAVNRVIFLTL